MKNLNSNNATRAHHEMYLHSAQNVNFVQVLNVRYNSSFQRSGAKCFNCKFIVNGDKFPYFNEWYMHLHARKQSTLCLPSQSPEWDQPSTLHTRISTQDHLLAWKPQCSTAVFLRSPSCSRLTPCLLLLWQSHQKIKLAFNNHKCKWLSYLALHHSRVEPDIVPAMPSTLCINLD